MQRGNPRQRKAPAGCKLIPATNRTKYSGVKGGFIDLSNKGIPAEVARDLEKLGTFGLAAKTWSSYGTAENLLMKFHKEKNLKPELPITEDTTLMFIHWLATVRKLKAGTISTYLAGIRQLHVAKGMPEPKIRTEMINLILKGMRHKDDIEARNKQTGRRPITKEIMATLKRRLREWDTNSTNQRLLWAVATNLFHGAFRIGELLCQKASEFDPNFELMTNDIFTAVDSNQFRLKAPKEDRKGRSTIVDVYAAEGPNCPVRALRKWMAADGQWPDRQPAFRWSDGRPLTQNQFRKILKDRLTGHVEDPEAVFCTHSFRIGIASMLGALGYGDGEVQAVGRWSSRAFEEYMLLPRTKRMQMAKLMKKI
jgi:hypothetical protein